ncbi:hypothetical protein SV7mr_21350 [Stieleria bergensis]|uniref:Uncharacterized protein n=1 Tax=Stieleria bergensis TaxID=2528025 RepID=A0A517SU19_9BACT|nr:hypothetical protein SV7mr_21350 [Planctomycetes bacterium SV_7m_r]
MTNLTSGGLAVQRQWSVLQRRLKHRGAKSTECSFQHRLGAVPTSEVGSGFIGWTRLLNASFTKLVLQFFFDHRQLLQGQAIKRLRFAAKDLS